MKPEIRHMVVFNLQYPKDSEHARQFLADSKDILSAIPYADSFDICYEISQKNSYDYGFSFDFLKAEDYASYNSHPDHIKYVEERWNKEVTEFMEIDLQGV